MAMKKVCVVGAGRMGWAILRQLHQLDPEGQLELCAYDPLRSRDEDLDGHVEWLPRRWTDDEMLRRVQPHLIIHAAPFSTQPRYVELALAHGMDIITLGQMTDFVLGLVRERQYLGRGSRVVPDCGLAPGLLNILAADLMFEKAITRVTIECGGLPMDPSKGGPLHYGLSFNPLGLIQEYLAPAFFKDRGEVRQVLPLQGDGPDGIAAASAFPVHEKPLQERLQYFLAPPFLTAQDGVTRIDALESAYTADGTSVMPWDRRFAGIEHISYRTLRYQGHFRWFQAAHQMGILDSPVLLRILEQLPGAVPDIVLFRIRAFARRTDPEPRWGWYGFVLADPILDAFPGLEDGPVPVFSAMQHLTARPTVFVARVLLGLEPDLIRPDLDLMNGTRLQETLERGGVILPYELVQGQKLMEKIMALTPHAEFHALHGEPA